LEEPRFRDSHQELDNTSLPAVATAPPWHQRVLSLAVVGALILLGIRFQQDFNAERVLRENDQLHRSLEEALANVKHLRLSVDSLHSMDREIRQLAKLEPIPDEVRRMGVGGALYESTMPGISFQAKSELAQLERETRLLQASLSRARELVFLQVDRMRRLPSIVPVADGEISSRFGFREDPFNGAWRMHEGMDFQARLGTPVLATADGVVQDRGREAGFGLVVRLDHGDGMQTLYGHLSRIRVVVGQQVRRGDHIGDVGSTGRSTSAHLHYEVHRQGRPLNPEAFVMHELAALD
jgi:murein DD-endopeptidase MepM/ murein hydrolase activator NlpD